MEKQQQSKFDASSKVHSAICAAKPAEMKRGICQQQEMV
jgi:hypothetical protein